MFLKKLKIRNFAKNISTNHRINNVVLKTFVDSNNNILAAGSFTSYKKSKRSYLVSLNNDEFSLNFDGKFNTTVNVVKQQVDGKLLIGGTFSNYGGTAGRNCLIRLNSDLTLDTNFCTNATDGSKFFSGNNINVIATQPDGKILISGSAILNYSGYYTFLRLNSDGTLDTAFCNNAVGTGLTLNGGLADIIVQPDGKILIAGSFQNYKLSGRNSLARLNSDGTLDTDFCANASDGSQFQTSAINSIDLQSDGKIVVGGAFTTYEGTTGRARLVRLNSDGTLDTAFCNNASDGTKFSSIIFTTKVQQDGKIIIGGAFVDYAGISGRSYLIRLNSDGTLDTDFCVNASDGNKFGIASIRCLDLQIDGKILVGGFFSNYSSTAGRNNLIRLNSDGTLDAEFCINYIDYLPNENLIKFNNSIRSLANQSDNKLLIGGNFSNYKEVTGRNCLIRLNSDGTLDTAFCNNASDGTKFSSIINDMAVQSDNKVLIGGAFIDYAGFTGRSRLIRLNSDGTLDTAFCNNAVDGAKFGNIINSIAIQTDGKIVIGGSFTNYAGTSGRNRLIRLNSDGTLDTSFCVNASDGTKFNASVLSIYVQTDGKIVIGGSFTNYAGTSGRNFLIRLNSDGTLDTDFCVNASDGTKFNNTINTVTVQNDGNIIIGGAFSNYGGIAGRNRVLRLNSDGTLDTAFCNLSVDGTKFNNIVYKIINYSNDNIFAGDFTVYYSADRNRVFDRILILNISGYAK